MTALRLPAPPARNGRPRWQLGDQAAVTPTQPAQTRTRGARPATADEFRRAAFAALVRQRGGDAQEAHDLYTRWRRSGDGAAVRLERR